MILLRKKSATITMIYEMKKRGIFIALNENSITYMAKAFKFCKENIGFFEETNDEADDNEGMFLPHADHDHADDARDGEAGATGDGAIDAQAAVEPASSSTSSFQQSPLFAAFQRGASQQ